MPDKADRLEPFKAVVKFSAEACDKGGDILHLRNATIHKDTARCEDEAAPYNQYRTHYEFWVKPTGTGDVALWVPEGEAQDTSGDLNQASEVSTVGVMDVVALTRKFIQDNMLTRARRIIGEEDPDMLKRRLIRKGHTPDTDRRPRRARES